MQSPQLPSTEVVTNALRSVRNQKCPLQESASASIIVLSVVKTLFRLPVGQNSTSAFTPELFGAFEAAFSTPLKLTIPQTLALQTRMAFGEFS